MRLNPARLVIAGLLAGVLAGSVVRAQESASSTPPLAVTETQMAQIRRALGQPSVLRLDERQLRFYLEIVGRQPHKFSASEFFKGYDLINGPTARGNPMSHQEFLDLINPKELHSTAGITPAEMLQFAMTNWLGQSLIKKALDDVRNARTEKEIQEIRERIDRELAALRGADSSQ
jgi:hypothetical protein